MKLKRLNASRKFALKQFIGKLGFSIFAVALHAMVILLSIFLTSNAQAAPDEEYYSATVKVGEYINGPLNNIVLSEGTKLKSWYWQRSQGSPSSDLSASFNSTRQPIFRGGISRPGNYVYVFDLDDFWGNPSKKAYITINAVASNITISPSSLPDGKVGEPYSSRTLSASGGVSPYIFKEYDRAKQPPGLTLNSSSGVFSGTPTKAGTYKFWLGSTDRNGSGGGESGTNGWREYVVTIADAPVILVGPSNISDTKVGKLYDVQFTGSGGQSPYTFTLDSGSLPPGLTLGASGRLTGRPTAVGNFVFYVRATDAEGFSGRRYSIINVDEAPTIALDLSLPSGKVGLDYGSHKLAATGGTAPYTYVVTGLPDGLTATGDTISGTPTRDGSFEVEVTTTDAEGYVATKTKTIVIAPAPVIDVDLSALPGGKVGLDYGSHKLAATGGTAPYTYVVTGLPDGLTATGDTISGKPTTAGSFDVTVTATDTEGYTGAKTQTVVIATPDIQLDLSTLPAGKIGRNYGSHKFMATGGIAPYTYEVTGLPAGLKLSGDTVSGIPAAAGSFHIEVTTTDVGGYAMVKGGTLVIAPAPVIELNPSTLPTTGKVGLDYGAHQFSATGGTEPYSFSTNWLPAGLKFTGNTLSGKPEESGSVGFWITVTDAEGYTKDNHYNLLIAPAPTIEIEPASLPSGKVGLAYGPHKLSASGGTAPYKYSVNGLPAGLTLDGDTISGTPTEEINFGIWVTARDAEGFTADKEYTVRIFPAPVIDVDLSALPGGKVGLDYGSHKLAASGGTGPYSYVVSGLPDGLMFSNDTVSGTPIKAGNFSVDVTATDVEGYVVAKTKIISISSANWNLETLPAAAPGYLPSGNLGEAYETKLQASGAIAPYSYAVTGLPDGLTLNGDTISGIPTKPDQGSSFDTSITVTDAAGNVQTFGRKLSINSSWKLETLPASSSGYLPSGNLGEAYETKLQASGAIAPYSYAVTGLP
ncbi:putative Ig domain-containing protein, partial [Brucella anthropi]|uniref:putative Ig domain-containing protein n=1 Tax=Brucella anthropi TaxID=529 RepID=UPI0015FE45C8